MEQLLNWTTISPETLLLPPRRNPEDSRLRFAPIKYTVAAGFGGETTSS